MKQLLINIFFNKKYEDGEDAFSLLLFTAIIGIAFTFCL